MEVAQPRASWMVCLRVGFRDMWLVHSICRVSAGVGVPRLGSRSALHGRLNAEVDVYFLDVYS